MNVYLPGYGTLQFLIAILLVSLLFPQRGRCQEIAGINVTPHNQSSLMEEFARIRNKLHPRFRDLLVDQ